MVDGYDTARERGDHRSHVLFRLQAPDRLTPRVVAPGGMEYQLGQGPRGLHPQRVHAHSYHVLAGSVHPQMVVEVVGEIGPDDETADLLLAHVSSVLVKERLIPARTLTEVGTGAGEPSSHSGSWNCSSISSRRSSSSLVIIPGSGTRPSSLAYASAAAARKASGSAGVAFTYSLISRRYASATVGVGVAMMRAA